MNKTIVIYGSSTGTCQSIAEKIASKLKVEAIDVQTLDAGVVDSNLSGKTIAIFGCGDCESYGDTFVSAMGELYNGLKGSGAAFIGRVPTAGYNFSDSEAVVDGEFVGLALDDVNEEDKTDERIDAWIESIKDKL